MFVIRPEATQGIKLAIVSEFWLHAFWFSVKHVNTPASKCKISTGVSSIYQWTFYPPKGKAERTRWGPLDSLSNLICVWETKMELSKTRTRIGLFWNLKNLYCPGGWVDRWVGGRADGDQKCTSISFIFQNFSKYYVFILQMVSKENDFKKTLIEYAFQPSRKSIYISNQKIRF